MTEQTTTVTTEARRWSGRTLAAAAFALAGLSLTGAGVYAGLIANTTNTQSVSTGHVSLTLAADGAYSGFSTAITAMAPGDTQNRYVTLTNGSTIATRLLTLSVAGSSSNLLVNDATKGLHVVVANCAVAWVAGACTTPTTLLADTAVSTLTSTTSGNLVTGAVAATYHLKISIVLPDQTETVNNGTISAGIQDLSNTLTVTFTQAQRAGSTTDA